MDTVIYRVCVCIYTYTYIYIYLHMYDSLYIYITAFILLWLVIMIDYDELMSIPKLIYDLFGWFQNWTACKMSGALDIMTVHACLQISGMDMCKYDMPGIQVERPGHQPPAQR